MAVAPPKKCEQNVVGAMGECLFCDADNAEVCRQPIPHNHDLSILAYQNRSKK